MSIDRCELLLFLFLLHVAASVVVAASNVVAAAAVAGAGGGAFLSHVVVGSIFLEPGATHAHTRWHFPLFGIC